jgi:hypothetical protein
VERPPSSLSEEVSVVVSVAASVVVVSERAPVDEGLGRAVVEAREADVVSSLGTVTLNAAELATMSFVPDLKRE